MFLGNFDIKYFLQSRTLKLKESYKDWTKIGHVFLSEKISQRDPGNKPQSGDRIEFAVINPPEGKKHVLQGEMIEVPSYIKQNNIPINYSFYMKNQIMNPALQFLLLVDKNAEQIFIDIENKYKFKLVDKEPKDIEEVVKKVKVVKVSKVKKVKELEDVNVAIKKTSKKIMKKSKEPKEPKDIEDIIKVKKVKKVKELKDINEEIKKTSKKIMKKTIKVDTKVEKQIVEI
jgi:hypothetical protein